MRGAVSVQGVRKTYGPVVALDRVSLDVQPGGEFHWTFGSDKGDVKADATGLITVPALKVTSVPTTLTVSTGRAAASASRPRRTRWSRVRATSGPLRI